MRSHFGDKSSQFRVCSKTFSHSSDLGKHEITHCSKIPFDFDICKNMFPHSSALMLYIGCTGLLTIVAYLDLLNDFMICLFDFELDKSNFAF